MAIWVLVMEKIATLEEIERSWSLDDVMRAHALLSYKAELIQEQKKKAEHGNRKRTPN
jgi:hypothetical protein